MPKTKGTRWTASVLGDEVYDERGVVARVFGAPADRNPRARIIAAAPALLAACEAALARMKQNPIMHEDDEFDALIAAIRAARGEV